MNTQTRAPWSEHSEQSALGALLVKSEPLGWLDLDEEHFFAPQHRAIWRAMRAVYDRGDVLDPVTLEAELDRQGKLEAIGGLEYLSKLALFVPTVEGLESYVSALGEYRTTREVMAAASELLTRARDADADGGLSGTELLDEAVEAFARIGRRQENERTELSHAAMDFARRIGPETEARAKGLEGTTMLATGIESLDRELGGVPLGTLTGVAGRYGQGKSSFALNVADNAATRGRRAVVYSAEDLRERWVERIYARRSRVDLERIALRELTAIELADLHRAADELTKLDTLHIVHAHGWGARDIVRSAKSLGAELVVVDYAQKLAAPEPRMKRHDAIEESAKILAEYAGQSGAAVLLLSQLNKGAKTENRRPTEEDLRYGEGVAQESKLLLLLHDPRLPDQPSVRHVLVPKRNQGEAELVLEVEFDGAHCEFR